MSTLVRVASGPRPARADGRGRAGSPPRRSARHAVAIALVHEAPAAAVMMAACAVGGAAALCAGAVALALLSIGYARAARTSSFAREHLIDLWAMLLLLAGGAFAGVPPDGSRATGTGHHHLAAVASAPVAVLLTGAAVVGWVLGRILLARSVRRPHTLVSAVVCGGMLGGMLLF